MYELVAVVGVTPATERRLRNPSALNLCGGGVPAHVALEEGLAHLGDEGGEAGHHAVDGDQLVDVCKKVQ